LADDHGSASQLHQFSLHGLQIKYWALMVEWMLIFIGGCFQFEWSTTVKISLAFASEIFYLSLHISNSLVDQFRRKRNFKMLGTGLKKDALGPTDNLS